MANEITKTSDNIEDLLDKVSGLIEQARTYVKTSVNTAEVYTKYYEQIGGEVTEIELPLVLRYKFSLYRPL